jgi:hypothetical protein
MKRLVLKTFMRSDKLYKLPMLHAYSLKIEVGIDFSWRVKYLKEVYL